MAYLCHHGKYLQYSNCLFDSAIFWTSRFYLSEPGARENFNPAWSLIETFVQPPARALIFQPSSRCY